MKLQQLIERSKRSFGEDPDKLPSAHSSDPFVRVHSTPQLVLEPIWEHPIDTIGEGPLYQEYIAAHPDYNGIFLRQKVAKRLYAAAKNLPSHLNLVLRAGHRPLIVQRKLLKELVERYLSEHSHVTTDDAVTYARIFVDDPDIKIPSHVCGSAVDVDVFDTNTGRLVDFGLPMNTNSEKAYLHTDKINETQHVNRMLLLEAMLKAGFAPIYAEWWHFSYGDRVWAYFYDEPRSLYDIQEPVWA